jgi:ABC-type dipeptide/oligopeptide/nickel transport system permease subunit
MRTVTLLFYAAATFFLGVVAAPYAASFGNLVSQGSGGAFQTLEVALTLALPIAFVAFAVLNLWLPPNDAASAQSIRLELPDLLYDEPARVRR